MPQYVTHCSTCLRGKPCLVSGHIFGVGLHPQDVANPLQPSCPYAADDVKYGQHLIDTHVPSHEELKAWYQPVEPGDRKPLIEWQN